MPLSLEQGRAAVRIARQTLDAHISGSSLERPSTEGIFAQSRGVFVTINRAERLPDRLRGCIGFPYPVKALGEAIRDATVAAASEDPRFPPVAKGELGSLVLEVSVLTEPEVLRAAKPQDRAKGVRIGTDGLIISRFGRSGLLLPQVATEFGMGQVEFLSQACMKAGLPPDSWLDKETEVKTFQAE
ncbi:MAG: TIGR00296 family protein, partial [Nitrososphaerota archaeon]|nr:TIGR00296 family protein [Nitrososphaerota archaeon]